MRHKFPILILFVCYIISFHITANAQEKFHISSQISNLHIRDICQDSLGYIWIATARGINRYNGYEYAQLFRDATNPDASIQSNRINRLYLDHNNNLWIATSRGVSRYDMTRDRITPYYIEKNEDYYATDIATDKQGDVWISTYNDGLYKFNPSTDTLQPFVISYRNKATPSYTRTIYVDNQNNLWIGYSVGSTLGKYNIDDQTSELIALPEHTTINCMTQFGASQLWIGTDQGIIAYNIKTRQFTPIPASLEEQTDISTSRINSITLIDNDNYIITSTRRAYKYCITTREVTPLTIGTQESDKNNDITCALKDNQGNIWLGTVEQGFYKIKTSENIFENLHELDGKPVVSNCKDLLFDRIWIGTKYDGLYLYSPKSGQVRPVTSPHLLTRKFQTPIIRSLFCDSYGRIWIGAGRNLIVGRLTPTGFTEISVFKDLSAVTAISQDKQGNIWVGSYSGLYFFDKHSTATPRTIVSNAPVKVIEPLDNHRIAYAIYGTDIFVTDAEKFEQEPLSPKDSLGRTITLNACTDMYLAQDSILWIANYNRGAMRYDPTDNTITTYTQKNGLPSNDILALTEDKNGRIWLATSNGLTRLDPKTERLRNFSEADGLSNTQFFEQAILTDSEGEIYLGGNSGIDRFDPANIKQNEYQPFVVLEDLKIQNQSIVPKEKGSPLSQNIAYAKKIVLKHRQNSFSIDYTGIDYTYTDKLRYAYKLEGFDKEWIETDGNKRAHFTNLPAGEYRFKVKAQNGDGEWSPEIGIYITVKASPWLTGWAYLIYFIVIVGGIILATKLYFRKKYTKKTQELAEQQRKHEQEINQQKIDFYGNISHELRTPLTLINGNIELLAQNARTGIHDMKLISVLSYNSGRLLKLVNQLLDFSRMESGSTPLRISLIDFNPILQNVINSFRFCVEAKDIKYEAAIDANLPMIYTDDDLLEKIITNLLSNAVKYTPRRGRIRIDVKYALLRTEGSPELETQSMIVNISNTCDRIEPHELDRLFDRFTRLTGHEDIPGSGIGLHYTKTLITRLHGKIHAAWDEATGLTMSFTIPVGRDSFAKDEIVAEIISSEETDTDPNRSELNELIPEVADAETSSTQTAASKSQSLLIVEDDPQIHTLLHEILHHEYNVLHAYDGAEGLQMIRSQMPEIVISDIRMPEMDGIALCKTVKNDPQLCHVIFILLTAKNRIEERIEGYNCGADAYINKPFRADHLISIIHNQQANRDRMKAFFHSQNPNTEQNDDDNDNRIPDSLSEIDRRFLEKLHQFIDKSIENPDININVIAVELGFSRTSFYRKMKGLTGLAPNDYVRNFKMKKAAKLILEGNLSIAEISDQTGFGTQSHFSTAFKKYFGVSPKDYKEKWKTEQQKSRTK